MKKVQSIKFFLIKRTKEGDQIRKKMDPKFMIPVPVSPWYVAVVIIVVIIVILIIWYYMASDPSQTTTEEMKLQYAQPGPKSYDFFNTLVTRRDTAVPIYETRREVEIYQATDEDFERERNSLIPIRANLNLVKPCDYIVSDTCYSSKQIAEMLQDHLDFSVDKLHVIATNTGKAHGDVWRRLPKEVFCPYP